MVLGLRAPSNQEQNVGNVGYSLHTSRTKGGLRLRQKRRLQPSSCWMVLTYISVLGAVARTRASWVDPDTLPEELSKVFEFDDRQFDLVFSDEFNREGRTFHDGHDPRWTSIHKNDYTNKALHFYSHDMVETRNGSLVITTNNTEVEFEYYDTPKKKFRKKTKDYISAMIQGWDKFCFTGGVLEIRARLPGTPDIGGLWPAMWLMGNLARATFTESSDFMWPWSYSECNRTTLEQASWQRQQEISACDSAVHYGMHPNVGRGSPEIDILEAMAGDNPGLPFMSTSFQVAPGTRERDRPKPGSIPAPGTWYEEDIYYGNNTALNKWFYGEFLEHELSQKSYYGDAVSANHELSATHFEEMHTYRLNWQPGAEDRVGFLEWHVDDEMVYRINDNTLNFKNSQISREPSYVLLNTAISSNWGFPPCDERSCTCDCYSTNDPKCECALDPMFYSVFPAEFSVDHVRVYQARNDSSHTVGCDTKAYPTRDFIKAHSFRYKEPNKDYVMLPVKKGGGKCRSSHDCNGNTCSTRGKCECDDGWTGPRCLAAEGHDDSVDRKDRNIWRMQRPLVPSTLWVIVLVLIVVFSVTLQVRYTHRLKRQLYVTLDSSGETIPPPAMSYLRSQDIIVWP